MTGRTAKAGLLMILIACGEEGSGTWTLDLQSDEVAFSGVWGAQPDDVWVVGGDDTTADVRRWDGSAWTSVPVPEVALLSWVHGTGPSDVWAVGFEGGVLHWDGLAWSARDAGTDVDLWGVFARAPDDVWIVGGAVDGGDPLLIHWDGDVFLPHELAPEDNPLGISALFKVWGMGETLFAVGQLGTILAWDGEAWRRSSAGPEANQDFVSLWGTSEDHILAVGGRSNARLSLWDGTSWTTTSPSGVGGLNGVFMDDPEQATVCGTNAYVASYDIASEALLPEVPAALGELHAVWGDGLGHHWAVGGQFREPWSGLVMKRGIP